MRVAIFGAGVAGLSAAQELVERGIDVDVYERLPVAGGKARSIIIQRAPQEGLPGEHGFRYFPGFYRHVIDTMSRIPRPGGGTVADNLVDAPAGNFAEAGYPPVEINTVGPTSLTDLVDGLRSMEGFARAIPLPDLEFFALKLWRVMTSCSERRYAEYEDQSWSTFLEADSRSAAYNTWFAGAMTHTLIAASGSQASSRTVGDITVQLITTSTQPGKPSDRLLNAPTSEAWIDPWVAHLESSGRFTLHTEHRLRALRIDGSTCVGVDVEFEGARSTITADAYLSAVPVEVLAPLVTDQVAAAAPTLGMTRLLADHVQWMAGIQIYLRRDTPIVAGHTMYVGSEWGLTSVSQQQFWPHHKVAHDSDGRVNGVLSVDISDWTSPGTNGKAARDCSPDEVCAEVLAQIRSCLADTPGVDLGDDNIDSYFIDPDVVFFGAGGGVEENYEPLLVNDMGTWWIRPNAYTEIPNLFLAGDFVRNNTDLATMEGANEAARRSVNAIIRAYRLDAPLCRLWNVHEPDLFAPLRWIDARRFAKGEPWTDHFPHVLRWLASVMTRKEQTRAAVAGLADRGIRRR
jgi:15-cis-phytoene desaturase